MRLIDAEKCPFCGGAKVNKSDEWLDICRHEWNYCPVCGRFIGDKVVAKNETITTETVYNRYTDTIGNYHWTGTYSGEHIVRMDGGERREDG